MEYDSIVRNSVWDVVLTPEDKSIVSSHWLYKVKKTADGSAEKDKARFVAHGLSKVEVIDYDETFGLFAIFINHIYIRTINTNGLEDTSNGCK